VYAITPEGADELQMLRDQGLERLQLHADPVDMALAASGGTRESDLRLLLEQRRRAIETRLAYDRAQHERATAGGAPSARVLAIMRHWELRLEAELAWHAEVEAMLPDIVSPPTHPPEPGVGDVDATGDASRIVPLPSPRGGTRRHRGGAPGS
jgi:hypothetical protein